MRATLTRGDVFKHNSNELWLVHSEPSRLVYSEPSRLRRTDEPDSTPSQVGWKRTYEVGSFRAKKAGEELTSLLHSEPSRLNTNGCLWLHNEPSRLIHSEPSRMTNWWAWLTASELMMYIYSEPSRLETNWWGWSGSLSSPLSGNSLESVAAPSPVGRLTLDR